MRARWRVLVAVLGTVMAVGIVPTLGSAAFSGSHPHVATSPEVLEVYFNPPVLVRAGEPVRLPVRVVCATHEGAPCASTATVGVRGGSGPWQVVTAPASPPLAFDLTAPASRAAGPGGSGVLDFYVRATGPAGATTSVPGGGPAAPARILVVRDLPAIHAPPIAFGDTRRGTTALYLPWGSGPNRAGLRPGRESATLGPSSFDVDAHGRIYIADAIQGRIAVFDDERMVRQIPVALSPRADVALTTGGAVLVLDRGPGGFTVRRIDQGRQVVSSVPVGAGIPVQVKSLGERALVDVLPQDQWIGIETADPGSSPTITPGRPVGEGEVLRAAAGDHLRLGVLAGDAVRDPVEVRFSQRVGEVALVEPDGGGGFWAVVHLSRDVPSPADQYQVLHIVGAQIVETFAVSDSRFADTPPLGRFRLGQDGRLYQLMTFPDGIRIVRYDLGRES